MAFRHHGQGQAIQKWQAGTYTNPHSYTTEGPILIAGLHLFFVDVNRMSKKEHVSSKADVIPFR
jgi:hypothetical protein